MKEIHAIDKNDPDFIEFFEAVKEKLSSYHAEQFPSLPALNFELTQGRKYIKIIRDRAVYAFINRENGDIMKPAGWKAPAKHARGNIFKQDALECCGPYSVAYLR